MQVPSVNICKPRTRAAWRIAATLLLLTPAVPAAESGAVDGIVRNSATQAPVARALVRLISESERGYVETTGFDGAFHFQKVEPGEYRISVERPGFSVKDSDILQVAAGRTTGDVILTAIPLAALRGKVVDTEGEPVPGAQVVAIHAIWAHGKRTWQSTGWAGADERGEFRMARLEPGRYRLFAAPPNDNPLRFVVSEGPGTPESRLAPAYYPSGQDLDAAASLDVAAGQELGGFEVKLPMRPSFHIRGRAETAPDSRGPMPVTATAVRIDNGRWAGWFQTNAQLNKDGTFDLAGVMPGSYVVSIERFGQALTGSIGVKVTARDVNGVALAKLQPTKVKVHYTYGGDPPAGRGTPQLQLERIGRNYAGQVIADEERVFAYVTRQPDGGIEFDNLPPGVYEPLLAPGTSQYVESVTYNNQPVTGGGLETAGGSNGELEVVLAAATAGISGKLKAPGSGVAIAVAQNATPGNRTVYEAAVDAGGRFSVPNLPPGRYTVFAVPRGQSWPWENEAFVKLLSGEAAAVELSANGSAQVEVAVIAEDTLRRAEEQIP